MRYYLKSKEFKKGIMKEKLVIILKLNIIYKKCYLNNFIFNL